MKIFDFFVTGTILIKYAVYPASGAIFWDPKYDWDFTESRSPTRTGLRTVNTAQPPLENVYSGDVVLLNSYKFGMTLLILVHGIKMKQTSSYFDMNAPYFYTNAYRWFLRYLETIPRWFSGAFHFVNTHQKVMKNRYYHKDDFIPPFFQFFLPHIKKDEWREMKRDEKRFNRISGPAFGLFDKFPNEVNLEDFTVPPDYREANSSSESSDALSSSNE